jgi:hypothetical protein
MDAVQPSMSQALVHPNKRVYAIEEDILLCTAEMHAQKAPSDLRQIHKQACKSIFSMAVILYRCSVVPHLQTYINVYLLWYDCMRAVFDERHQHPQHRKHVFAAYMQSIPLQKLTVLLPVVCFWVSIKCSDSFHVRTNDLARMIVAVHQERGDENLEYHLQDLRDTEDALLQLLDFDILKSQDAMDKMEEMLRAQFGEAYESPEAQAQIVSILCKMFEEVAESMT